MKLKNKHFLSIMALCLPLCLTACSDDKQFEAMPEQVENIIRQETYSADRVYTFMAEPSKMPLTARDELGNSLIGFEVDLLKAIGERENFDIKTRPQALSGLVKSLEDGSADIIGSGITVSEDMKDRVEFTQFYMTVGYALLVKDESDNINSLSDLVGKRLVVQDGTTAQEIANAALVVLASNSKAKVDAHIQVCFCGVFRHSCRCHRRCRCHATGYATCPVLSKTPRIRLKSDSIKTQTRRTVCFCRTQRS